MEVAPLSWDFIVLHNNPAARQDHYGRCRIRTRDLCLRSLARYQWATTSTELIELIIVYEIKHWQGAAQWFNFFLAMQNKV